MWFVQVMKLKELLTFHFTVLINDSPLVVNIKSICPFLQFMFNLEDSVKLPAKYFSTAPQKRMLCFGSNHCALIS